MKLIIDFLSNISSIKYNTKTIHEEGATNIIIALIEITELEEDKILMGCIDTIDGLCQLEQV